LELTTALSSRSARQPTEHRGTMMLRSSMAASTREPSPSSAAMKRRRIVGVGVATSATVNSWRIQPPEVPGPAGPTVSTGAQVAPLSGEISTLKTSALGAAPAELEYQRQ